MHCWTPETPCRHQLQPKYCQQQLKRHLILPAEARGHHVYSRISQAGLVHTTANECKHGLRDSTAQQSYSSGGNTPLHNQCSIYQTRTQQHEETSWLTCLTADSDTANTCLAGMWRNMVAGRYVQIHGGKQAWRAVSGAAHLSAGPGPFHSCQERHHCRYPHPLQHTQECPCILRIVDSQMNQWRCCKDSAVNAQTAVARDAHAPSVSQDQTQST